MPNGTASENMGPFAQPWARTLAMFAGFVALHLAWAIEYDRLSWQGFSRFTAFFLTATLATMALQWRFRTDWSWRTTGKVFGAFLVGLGLIVGIIRKL